MNMDEEIRLNLVVFGATGFTGYRAVRVVEKLAAEKSLTWGIAGRNETKLKDVLAKLSKETGKDFSNTEIIVADIVDDQSLRFMAGQASVIINCCGPYNHYGEPVVKACIAGGASYVDICAEPEFMERMQLEYDIPAEQNGVYIISACGVDSIPADVGAVYLQENFPGDVNSIEAFAKAWVVGSYKTACIHYGTWESGVYAAGNFKALGPLRRRLNPTPLPELQPKLRGGLLFRNRNAGWCIPFLGGTDLTVMQRTQRYSYDYGNNRPAQIAYYIALPSFFRAVYVAFLGLLFAFLSQFQCGKRLLLKHPRFFSGGFASREGPSEEQMENTHFELSLVGKGWKDKEEDPMVKRKTAPNHSMTVKVSCTDPAYGSTCVLLVLAAITVINESEKIPKSGGVITPGTAFKNTSLINELNSHGIKFEIIRQDSIV